VSKETTIAVLKAQIKALELQEKRINKTYYNEIEPIRKALEKFKLLYAEEAHGAKVGAIVVIKRKSWTGTSYVTVESFFRIAEVTIKSWNDLGKPWVTGNPKRTDGTYGTARRHLYGDWEVVT